MEGKVYIVGAGPGAADLLTVRAASVLQQAGVLLHDDLVTSEIIALAPPSAEVVNVGKRCGAMLQPAANQPTDDCLCEPGPHRGAAQSPAIRLCSAVWAKNWMRCAKQELLSKLFPGSQPPAPLRLRLRSRSPTVVRLLHW